MLIEPATYTFFDVLNLTSETVIVVFLSLLCDIGAIGTPCFFNFVSVQPAIGPQNGSKSHKWLFCGHKQAWQLQTGGSTWIEVGSSPGTSGTMCWDPFPGPEWPLGGAIGPQNGPKWPEMVILWP